MPKKGCKIEGCKRPHVGLGFCGLHHKRFWKTGDPGGVDPVRLDYREARSKTPKGKKWCPLCEDYRPASEFAKQKGQADELTTQCKYHRNLIRNEKSRQLRLAVIEAMGGGCVRCGFDDWRALQIDHVNSDGSTERKLLRGNSPTFYRKVLANPADYQLLCANHNMIKMFESDEFYRNPVPLHLVERETA